MARQDPSPAESGDRETQAYEGPDVETPIDEGKGMGFDTADDLNDSSDSYVSPARTDSARQRTAGTESEGEPKPVGLGPDGTIPNEPTAVAVGHTGESSTFEPEDDAPAETTPNNDADTAAWDPWAYRRSANQTEDPGRIVGYGVHATDGDIGKVDAISDDTGAATIVVDTGPWIFGRRVILPAGTIEHIDDDSQKVHIDLSKQQIKDSPELGAGIAEDDPGYRAHLGEYFGSYYV